ncbi:MAG: SDR family NAD(P)-dependent oxidoreductase [Bifidobacteriaceae bacterium]|jgi:short-subunit dehydrogenase|nr:SDR family NAD(P)-dependent oxidoreductase [Bifidobacteriaceae bacterium]
MGTAMITGASSGLGLEFAWQLAAARHDLVLVARDQAKLTAHGDRLRAAAGVDVQIIRADLSKRTQLNKLVERLEDTSKPVGLLVNNAGFGYASAFLDTPISQSEQAMDVMMRAVMVLSQAAAKQMVARGRGAILNVSSIATYTAAGPYSAAKAWVTSFTESLAVELSGTGVSATAVLPGLTRTDFHARAGIDVERFPELAWLNPSDVVARALADVRRGAVLSIPSVRYGLLGQLAHIAPRWLIRAVSVPWQR